MKHIAGSLPAVLAIGVPLVAMTGLAYGQVIEAPPVAAPRSGPPKVAPHKAVPLKSPTKVPPAKSDPRMDAPMRVRLVRSNQPGCEPSCPEWIAAEGRIDDTTPGEFRRVLTRLGTRKLPVLIESPGGSVDPAFAVARMIRAKGLSVAVTRTVLTPCSASDETCRRLEARGIALGRPVARVTICASSCAFILAGGVRRYVGQWTIVGLHEIKLTRTFRIVRERYRLEPRYGFGAPVEPRKTVVAREVLRTHTQETTNDERTYLRVRRFFVEMGVTESIMPILRSAPHTSIRWLRPAELTETRLATDLLNGEQLLLGTGSSAPAPVVPPPAPAAPPAPTTPPTTAPPPLPLAAPPNEPDRTR